MHVTLRARRCVRCLRAGRVFPAVRDALAAASGDEFRILHFSVQADHVHLIVEAGDSRTLSRGLQGLAVRIARAVNRVLGRRGAVWDERYHARALSTPREVRHALVYVLMNRQKHCERERGLDPCSSAVWFTGWRHPIPASPVRPPVVRPRTWLASVGWRRHGLLGLDERPHQQRSRKSDFGPPGSETSLLRARSH